ncbi:hypothetical protein B296_00011470 [Ensete ventricosum]|uniref:Uncharacterized protein n=1 Tax=Ensete ventricosum TaxID=4639 RepID=A0A427B6N1_ENSVE|nr:hypothetical protein B296_00011470 [Ensete ventricosum]
MEEAEHKGDISDLPNEVDAGSNSPVEAKGSEIESTLDAKEREIGPPCEAKESEIEPSLNVKEGEIEVEGGEKEPSPCVEADASNGSGIRTFTMRELLDELKEEEKEVAGGEDDRSWSLDPTKDDGSDAQRNSFAERSSFRAVSGDNDQNFDHYLPVQPCIRRYKAKTTVPSDNGQSTLDPLTNHYYSVQVGKMKQEKEGEPRTVSHSNDEAVARLSKTSAAGELRDGAADENLVRRRLLRRGLLLVAFSSSEATRKRGKHR